MTEHYKHGVKDDKFIAISTRQGMQEIINQKECWNCVGNRKTQATAMSSTAASKDSQLFATA